MRIFSPIICRHILAVLTVPFLSTSLLAQDDGEPPSLEKLVKQWQDARAAIVTTHLRYRSFIQGGSGIKPLATYELEEIIGLYDLPQQPDDIRGVSSQVLVNPDQFETPWSVRTFMQGGDRYRDDRGDTLFVYDGKNKVYRDRSSGGHEHISINGFPGGTIVNIVLSNFMFIPDFFAILTEPDLGQRTSKVVATESGFMYRVSDAAQTNHMVLHVDSDGWLSRAEHQSANGEPVNVYWYQG